MARRRVLIAVMAALIVGGLLASAAGVGALYVRRERQDDQYLELADAAFKEGRWRQAKDNYALRLLRHPDDVELLRKYAEASLNIIDDRQRALRDAGAAKLRIALASPDDLEARRDALEFLKDRRFWGELQHAAGRMKRAFGESPELASYEAAAYLGMRRTLEAIDRYTTIVEGDDATPDDYLGLARANWTRGLMQGAQARIDEALERFPDDAQAHRAHAEFLLETGRTAQAREAAERAYALAPNDLRVALVRARAAIAQSDADVAMEMAQTAAAADPTDAQALILLAEAHRQRGEAEEAVRLLADVDLYLQIDQPQILVVLAEMQLLVRDIEGTRATVELYLRAYPQDRARAQYFEARELMVEGRPEEAASILTNVVRSHPAFSDAQFYLVIAQLQAGDLRASRGTLRGYMRSNPGDDRGRLVWELLFAPPRAYAEVAEEAEALLASSRTILAGALTYQAQALMASAENEGVVEEARPLAIRLLSAAIEREPGEPDAYRTLAGIRLDQNDADGAREAVSAASAAGVPETEFALVRGAIALHSGDVETALDTARAHTQRDESTRQTVLLWADLFTRHSQVGAARQLLGELAAAADDPADRAAYLVEEVSCLRRAGDLLSALDRAVALAGEFSGDASATARLDGELDVFRRVLLATNQPETIAQARAMLDQLGDGGPVSVGIVATRAELALAAADPDLGEAERLARETLAVAPDHPDALIVLYDIARRLGQTDRARGYAEEALKAAPDDYRAQLAAAEARLATGAVPSAIEVLEPPAYSPSGDLRMLELLTRAYALDGRAVQAQRALNQIRTRIPDEPVKQQVVGTLSGWVSLLTHDTAAAIATLEAERAERPDDPAVTQLYARALAAAGRADEALDVLTRFAEAHPSDPDGWSMVGQFLLAQGDPEDVPQALGMFRRALALSPEHQPALRGMIDVQYRLGNTGAALVLAERYLEKRPEDGPIHYLSALVLANTPGRIDEALASVTRAIDVAPRPEYYSLRGFIRLDQGAHAEALSDLRRYLEALPPVTADLDAAMAEAYLATGDPVMAQQYFDSARRKAATGEMVDTGRMRKVEEALVAQAQSDVG